MTARQNGETQRLADFFLTPECNEPKDTSIDGVWLIQDFGFADIFTVTIMILGCVLKLPVVLLLLMMTTSLPLLLNCFYFSTLCEDIHSVNRSGVLWTLHISLQWLLSVPAQCVVFLNLTFDYLFMNVFGLIWVFLSCSRSRLLRNREVVSKYSEGPSLYLHFTDIVIATGGQLRRQGFLEMWLPFCIMFIVNPWIKYWISVILLFYVFWRFLSLFLG